MEEGCQPIAFWSLNRHGSHNPEADELENLQRLSDLKKNVLNNYRNGNYRNFNERMCSADVNILERWEWNPRHNLTYAGDLTSDGYINTQQLAQAWRQRYPGLLTTNQHDYMIKYANTNRLKTTLKAFTEGIFKSQAEDMDIVKKSDEELLAPQKSCSAWINNIEKNNETYHQKYIFESKREFKEMITNISQRMGFSWDIHPDIIKAIYQQCRYNKAWDVSQISPWCAVFSREDLRRLEYSEDLETYYKYGYGSDVNPKIGCNLVKDLMAFFTNHVEKEAPQQPRTLVYLTEMQSILFFLTAINTHHDNVPLTGDNYHSSGVQNRKWSSSSMVPFNANIAAVLYKCTPNGNFQYNDRYQILFLENEKSMNLEGCRVGLCDWSTVKKRFGDIADNCNMEACNSASQTIGVLKMVVAIVAVVRFVLWAPGGAPGGLHQGIKQSQSAPEDKVSINKETPKTIENIHVE
ncbi:histidine phosphatase superfamily (branch 2) domain-containing protein [Phthorimaea operculella]|nr:histidine phosphatase superfamily (branch 2) domain-containing protein [Phthorimaea operculella]